MGERELGRTNRLSFVAAALLVVSACSGEPLPSPGELPPPPPPVGGVLQIASFSVVESRIPGDYFCDGFCLTPFVDVVEKTGVGRAYIKSITVLGYRVPSATANSCSVQPGRHLNLVLNDSAWLSDSSIGQERTIVITYDDGTGLVETLSARALVTSTAPESQVVNHDCRLGNATLVSADVPGLGSTVR